MAREIPNKFNVEAQMFAIVKGSDQDGFYNHFGCEWLIGYTTFRAPHRLDSFKGAVDWREMSRDEIKRYLTDVEENYRGEISQRFVSDQRKKLSKK